MSEIIDINYEVLPDQLSVDLLEIENECIECIRKLKIVKTYISDPLGLCLIEDVINTLGFDIDNEHEKGSHKD